MILSGRVYTTAELAIMLLVAPRTVRKWIEDGKLPARRTAGGKHRRVSHVDLLAFLGIHWPGWREGLSREYTAPLRGSSPEWWRGVGRGWLQRRPCLRDWLALLGCDRDFAEQPGD
jgi:excisionase family DNA binding protein